MRGLLSRLLVSFVMRRFVGGSGLTRVWSAVYRELLMALTARLGPAAVQPKSVADDKSPRVRQRCPETQADSLKYCPAAKAPCNTVQLHMCLPRGNKASAGNWSIQRACTRWGLFLCAR